MSKTRNKRRKLTPKTARIPRARGEFGFTVPEAGAMINLSPNSSYAAAKRGEIPTVKIGALLVVPKVLWLKKLGVEDTAA